MKPDSISPLDLIQARTSEVPAGWQLCKVDEALNIRNNFRKPISQEVRETIKGQYPYYGPTKVQGYISEYEQDGTYALIGEDGDHFLKFGAMAQTQFISGKCTVNNHAHILESSTFCDSEWFFNYFKHRDITNFLSRQGAGRFKLNKATLEKLPMLVPPLPEQRKIAKILSTWDKAITTTEKLIETSKQQKKALMQQLLTGKKRVVNPLTGKVFEGEWEEVKLGEYSQVTSSKRVLKSDYVVTGVPFYRSKEIILKSNNIEPKEVLYISEEQFDLLSKKHGRPDTGDILITAVGSLGVPYLVQEKETFYFKDGNLLWLRKINELDGSFLIHYMKSEEFQNKIDSITGGSSQKALTIVKLATLTVPMPSMEEQQKIASVLTAADKEIEVLEAKLAHFKQEKKALMQQLLTGKRRVKIEHME
ncbi:restriction endonuclease subunit S [Vibrio crassostreae]|uniref:restriction endonuclease subunit S n=1 Tax=Vibrio crassostreae TaxID=246167 RepID=UPI000F46D81A|nr:restriction endonuclease subunit S [Vibrio crassostreae]ROQ71897.1 type I restriction enzyme S subunit [Vibrio crassostreae]ROR77287.1 type I restriction enzyme S subunit [Vibrio crassostreae]RPE99241.1 type I restriction enzyme S subunit [Vibrio crassostreae]TQL30967.1 type I restriction enzyme S subunit [Vibrio crassostreae]